MRSPFQPHFRMHKPGLNTPFAVLVLNANLPLVRMYTGFHEMRENVVDAARIPGLYIEGLSLTAMGGEPYSIWN